ncbi:MAG: type I methionyl aminopeptidase [Armatimonadota bacterium]|nr:type I methionyl aminopeptidase [Armatimonadota bacterium]MCX7776911.1 type I methionyl aminopeptidase [Armatimonadota bacterium]MDW8024743.1 type I methionyl aminopeptidase [Armatimonadota bacterium]
MRRIFGKEKGIILKGREEIRKMRIAGAIVYGALKEMASAIRPGVTPLYLDKLAENYIRKCGAIPSFLGYKGYPASTCIAVNEQVVHAIPNDRPLKEGDIVGLDTAACWDGYHADAAITVPVGEVSEIHKNLVKTALNALWIGINEVSPGKPLSRIGAAIQNYVEMRGFHVVRDLVGHGIGKRLHEKPEVPHYFTKMVDDIILTSGMTLCIEPMINVGTHEVTYLSDGWTVVTADGSYSAHFEHTIAITENGVMILTLGPNDEDDLWRISECL